MQEISDDLKTKFAQFQTMQQQLQMIGAQKQQLTMELVDSEEAKKEVGKSKGDVYRAVGPILIKAERGSVETDLEETISSAQNRLSLLENQEKKLATKAQELQKELQSQLKGLQGG